MNVSDRIRADLARAPDTPNFMLVQRYGCTNALVSKIRKSMGIPFKSWKSTPRMVALPEYMIPALTRMAEAEGNGVTVQDLVIGVLNDVIAEQE